MDSKVGRNDPCPCGSGKKFKRCHLGREQELPLDHLGEMTPQTSAMIAALPAVDYGRCREMADALDLQALTGAAKGIRFVDLQAYSDLNLFGGVHRRAAEGRQGGVFVNPYKTVQADPDHLVLAISPGIDDSCLIHELAHVLDYLGGSQLMAGTLEPLSRELGIPADHLDHPEEFGRWLEDLRRRFEVQPDADDRIVLYLYENGLLLKGDEIRDGNRVILKSKSDRIFLFLNEHSKEIDALIRELPGYAGSHETPDDN